MYGESKLARLNPVFILRNGDTWKGLSELFSGGASNTSSDQFSTVINANASAEDAGEYTFLDVLYAIRQLQFRAATGRYFLLPNNFLRCIRNCIVQYAQVDESYRDQFVLGNYVRYIRESDVSSRVFTQLGTFVLTTIGSTALEGRKSAEDKDAFSLNAITHYDFSTTLEFDSTVMTNCSVVRSNPTSFNAQFVENLKYLMSFLDKDLVLSWVLVDVNETAFVAETIKRRKEYVETNYSFLKQDFIDNLNSRFLGDRLSPAAAFCKYLYDMYSMYLISLGVNAAEPSLHKFCVRGFKNGKYKEWGYYTRQELLDLKNNIEI